MWGRGGQVCVWNMTHMVRDLKLKLAQATQVWGLGRCGEVWEGMGST